MSAARISASFLGGGAGAAMLCTGVRRIPSGERVFVQTAGVYFVERSSTDCLRSRYLFLQTAKQFFFERFEAEVVKVLDNLGGELEQMRQRKESLEREVANLANVVAQGDFSPALRAALVHRERQTNEMTAKLLEARPDSLRAKLRNSRGLVTARMQNLRTIMNSDISHVPTELAKHIEKITLTPSGECYVASGTWNLVGRANIDCAGGPTA